MWSGNSKKSASSPRNEITPTVRMERSFLARLFGVLWRWRTELITVMISISVWTWLAISLNPLWALVIKALFIGALFAIRSSRRFIIRRFWCVLTRHRMRSCMVQLKVENRSGRLPFILWVRPTAVGEKVKLFMRPGQSIENLAHAAKVIAAACWAREARIENNRARTHIVMVHIVRRDPLSEPTPIASPLMTASSDFGSVEVENVIPLASKPAKQTAVLEAEKPSKTSKKTKNKPSATLSANGEDVSDYVD